VIRAWVTGPLLLSMGGPAALAQGNPITLPLPAGSVVVQTLSFTGGDRESFLSLQEVSNRGSRYGWQFREVQQTGDTIRRQYEFFEGMPDVVASVRLLVFHTSEGSQEHPGYT
jgi:hypothetical protein